jgi:hypothetical protein
VHTCDTTSDAWAENSTADSTDSFLDWSAVVVNKHDKTSVNLWGLGLYLQV